MPRDQGLANVHDYRDLEVIAVIMPNDPGVRNVDWHTYQTTVDAVEALSGYDLLKLLPDNVERAVESNTKPPIAALDGPYTSAEGSAVNMSAAASVDLNGSITGYAWTFGDGASANGVSVSHTFAQDGDYAVRLIVTDNDGLADTVNTTAHVANVAPTIDVFAGASLFSGDTYTAAGAFTDPGADTWTATVNYGDGSPTATLALSGKTFSLSHVYSTAGTFTVTVRVSDDDVTSIRTATVVVASPAAGVQGRDRAGRSARERWKTQFGKRQLAQAEAGRRAEADRGGQEHAGGQSAQRRAQRARCDGQVRATLGC
jgi:hypothetical protein